jgi:hypothetical protein
LAKKCPIRIKIAKPNNGSGKHQYCSPRYSERVFSTEMNVFFAQKACLSNEQVDIGMCLSKNLIIPSDFL